MSPKQLRHGADFPWPVRPVGPAPPDVSVGALPQRPTRPPAIVLPLGAHEATRPHGLAALRAGRNVVAHTMHLSDATASSRSNLGGSAALGWCGSELPGWSVGVRGRPPLFGGVVTQLDTHAGSGVVVVPGRPDICGAAAAMSARRIARRPCSRTRSLSSIAFRSATSLASQTCCSLAPSAETSGLQSPTGPCARTCSTTLNRAAYAPSCRATKARGSSMSTMSAG